MARQLSNKELAAVTDYVVANTGVVSCEAKRVRSNNCRVDFYAIAPGGYRFHVGRFDNDVEETDGKAVAGRVLQGLFSIDTFADAVAAEIEARNLIGEAFIFNKALIFNNWAYTFTGSSLEARAVVSFSSISSALSSFDPKVVAERVAEFVRGKITLADARAIIEKVANDFGLSDALIIDRCVMVKFGRFQARILNDSAIYAMLRLSKAEAETFVAGMFKSMIADVDMEDAVGSFYYNSGDKLTKLLAFADDFNLYMAAVKRISGVE